jgi:hypothetical protein
MLLMLKSFAYVQALGMQQIVVFDAKIAAFGETQSQNASILHQELTA